MSNSGIRRAVVTGASSGIGAALARRLAGEGVEELVLVARRQQRLEALAGELDCDTQVVACDLSEASGVETLVRTVPRTDLLVNNVGFGLFGPFSELDATAQDSMLQLNCLAPVRLTSHYLPAMIRAGRGSIVNIISSNAFQCMPYMTTYAATKAFLLHWSEGLHEELRGTGVRVVGICPGTTPTEFNASAAVPEEDLGFARLVSNDVEQVVDATLAALRANRPVKVVGFANTMAVCMGALVPRSWNRWLLGRLLSPVARKKSAAD